MSEKEKSLRASAGGAERMLKLDMSDCESIACMSAGTAPMEKLVGIRPSCCELLAGPNAPAPPAMAVELLPEAKIDWKGRRSSEGGSWGPCWSAGLALKLPA